jgi:hypothetical protein
VPVETSARSFAYVPPVRGRMDVRKFPLISSPPLSPPVRGRGASPGKDASSFGFICEVMGKRPKSGTQEHRNTGTPDVGFAGALLRLAKAVSPTAAK